MAIYNSTLAFNVAQASIKRPRFDEPPATEGGALYNLTFGSSASPPAVVHLANSLLTNNLAIHDLVNNPLQGEVVIDSSRPNLVQNCTFCDNRAVVSRLQIITGIDPVLCPRAERPCTVANLVPPPSNPAIGRSNPEVCDGALVGGADRSGKARAPSCTLGAYESAPQDAAPSSGCQASPHDQPGGAPGLALLAVTLALLRLSRGRERTPPRMRRAAGSGS